MAKKKTKRVAGDSVAGKKGKRVNVEIAPAVFRRLKDERENRNASPDRSSPAATYTEIINEALDRFLAPGAGFDMPIEGGEAGEL